MRATDRLSGRSWPVAAACLVLAGGAAGAADWAQFRGPARDGVSGETGLAASWPEGGPRQVFRVPLGGGYSGISVAGGRLFTLFSRGEDEFAACLDAADGREIWRVRIDATWKDDIGPGPRSTPTVEGPTAFALSGRGKLFALAAADGRLQWQHDLVAEYGAAPPRWGVSTSPLIEGRLLLVDVGGRKGASIVAFDKASGAEVWRSQTDKAGYSAPIAITAGGLRQVVAFTGTRLRALAPADGALLWDLPWETSYDVNAATPVFIAPDRLFVSSAYNVGGALLRLDVAEGRVKASEVWRNTELKSKFHSAVLAGGQLYGFDEGTFKCLDPKTGETRWRQRGLGHGSLIVADGHLLALGDAGTLVLVQATPEAYRERARAQPFSGRTWTAPALSGGRLYLRDEKELVALEVGG
jgi:outer membrane protein assembly factor BamB